MLTYKPVSRWRWYLVKVIAITEALVDRVAEAGDGPKRELHCGEPSARDLLNTSAHVHKICWRVERDVSAGLCPSV